MINNISQKRSKKIAVFAIQYERYKSASKEMCFFFYLTSDTYYSLYFVIIGITVK